jgi:hypothetical protein
MNECRVLLRLVSSYFWSSDRMHACFSCVPSQLVHKLAKVLSDCPTFLSCPTRFSELTNNG